MKTTISEHNNFIKKTIMKKIIIIITLIISTYMAMAVGVEVNGRITIGKKSSGNCSGFGFCSMSGAGNSSPKDGMRSTFLYNSDNNTLVIGISRNEIQTINASKLQYFEGKNSITLEENFTVPAELAQQFGFAKTVTIRRGTYNLSYTNGIYYITIVL